MSDSVQEQINFKALNGQVNIDEAQGIVECFVAAVGNKDSVGDVVATGAFNESLKRRKPRVVWGHSWNDPIGKVLEIYEVPSSDPRLPAKMKMAGVGGLFAKVQFNLATEKGREAFASVAFFGHEQEWSIGYKTLNATFDPQAQANVLHEVELYEVSPVLHGANALTGTISVKSDEGDKCGMPDGPTAVMTPRGPAIVGRPVLPQAPVRHYGEHHREYSRRREDIFAEGEARQLPDEALNALSMELMSRSRSRLDVLYATENSVVFNRDAGNGNMVTYRLGYHYDIDSGEYMFGKPEKIGIRNEESRMPSATVFSPQMPPMPMSVKPQMGMPSGLMFMASGGKSLDEQMHEAANIIFDVTTGAGTLPADKITRAIELLESLKPTAAKSQEQEVFTVLCTPVEAYHVKSLLDPVIDYHRLDADIDDEGIHISNGLTEDAITALERVAASIDEVLYGKAGGSKKF